jgi:acyl carrier protein
MRLQPSRGTSGARRAPIVDFEPGTGVIHQTSNVRLANPLPIGSRRRPVRSDRGPQPSDTRLPLPQQASVAITTNSIQIERGMTGSAAHLKPDLTDITSALVDYILSQHPSKFTRDTLPRDESLLELEVLDSAGVIEFIVFAETTWGIEISDEDITRERMGSLNKMAALVQHYAAQKK